MGAQAPTADDWMRQHNGHDPDGLASSTSDDMHSDHGKDRCSRRLVTEIGMAAVEEVVAFWQGQR